MRTKIFRTVYPNHCRAIFLWFDWHSSKIIYTPMAQGLGQQASETLGTGSEASIYLYLFALLMRFLIKMIFFCSHQGYHFFSIFSWYIMKCKADFCSYIVLFLMFLFQYLVWKWIFCFFPDCFSRTFFRACESSLIQAQPCTRKHQKVPYDKRSLIWNIVWAFSTFA